MSEIDLADGEVEEIINQRDAEGQDRWILEVTGSNDIRYSHDERYASEGTTVPAGMQTRLTNLRGDRLFVSAFDGATTIRVMPASADNVRNPNRDVTILEGDVTVSDAATEDKQDDIIALLQQIESNTAP